MADVLYEELFEMYCTYSFVYIWYHGSYFLRFIYIIVEYVYNSLSSFVNLPSFGKKLNQVFCLRVHNQQ